MRRALAAVWLLAAACGSEAKPGAGGAAADGTFYGATLETLRAAGLTVGAFAAAAGPEECAKGEVEGLQVLVCKAPADAQIEAAAPRAFVDGAISGAVRKNGAIVLAVADRDKKDPNGRTLNRVLKAFAPTPAKP